MDTKICTLCKNTLPLDQFHRCNKTKLHPYCKACKKLYNQQWYKDHQDQHIENTKLNNEKYRNEIQELIRKIKDKPCLDCGKKYPYYVMDFDHLKDKEFNIANAIAHRISKTKILREIRKCEVVCANCHRARTHARFTSSMERVDLS